MIYQKINLFMVGPGQQDVIVDKGKWFYDYLVKNNVAYYYSTQLIKRRNETEKKIIRIGNKFNKKFKKTLKLVNMICELNSIDYCIFKTYKYVPDAYFGDIDLIVKPKDLFKVVGLFKKENFLVKKETREKYELTHSGHAKVEVRSNVSHHGFTIFKNSDVWKNIAKKNVLGMSLNVTTAEFDVATLLLNVLYGPKYIDLYLYILMKKVNLNKLKQVLWDSALFNDIEFLVSQVESIGMLNYHFPYFLGDFNYSKWWFRRVFLNMQISALEKIRLFTFFFFSKYKYLIFGKLYFEKNYLS